MAKRLFDLLLSAAGLLLLSPLLLLVALYPAALRDKVLSVRPGITDPASIRFRDENALLQAAPDPEREYTEVVLPTKLRYAAEYVDQASLATDLRLIGLTLKTLLTRG